MQRNARRPSHGSNVSLNSHRKSSINPRDLERIQAAVQATVQNRHRLSPRFIIFIIVLSPIFIFVYNCAVTHFDGSLIRVVSCG
ncbi:hypothetical protein AB6A40_003701 [Gnathostoma spinigerum]|uniref:Uncharacterized protein n=1 Tax=Gnathostoma spinigerum TaxID=75299 RepID=A0ABD6ECK2_9BILA